MTRGQTEGGTEKTLRRRDPRSYCGRLGSEGERDNTVETKLVRKKTCVVWRGRPLSRTAVVGQAIVWYMWRDVKVPCIGLVKSCPLPVL